MGFIDDVSRKVKAKAEELNKPGRLLPGVKIESYYDRSDLINVTTETVHYNLIMGMVLVLVILLNPTWVREVPPPPGKPLPSSARPLPSAAKPPPGRPSTR